MGYYLVIAPNGNMVTITDDANLHSYKGCHYKQLRDDLFDFISIVKHNNGNNYSWTINVVERSSEHVPISMNKTNITGKSVDDIIADANRCIARNKLPITIPNSIDEYRIIENTAGELTYRAPVKFESKKHKKPYNGTNALELKGGKDAS